MLGIDPPVPQLRLGPSPVDGERLRLQLVAVEDVGALPALDPGLARRAGFSGVRGQVWVLPGTPDAPSPRVLVGAGPASDVTPEALVRAVAASASACAEATVVDVELSASLRGLLDPDALAWLVGSAVTFGAARAGVAAPSFVQLPGEAGGCEPSFTAGALTGLARARAAELVDTPPNQLTPAAFAARAREWSGRAGIACDVIDGERLVELGAGGLLAIGSGSVNGPVLVHVTSGPTDRQPDLVVVGKGITFDSGGLSLKGSDAMAAMKCDMAGAAVALTTALLAARLHPELRVDAVCALAENMPGGSACRPGDVVRTVSGRTIEILDTDFEGRVVLADALGYAMSLRPARVVDVATLTVASMFALGTEIGALFADDDVLAEQVRTSAEQVGEPLWRLPLDRRYDEQLDSDLADVRNFPAHPYGRAITAAAFLARFVDPGVPWVHLDIAGPAWAPAAAGRRGGTGFGVATLAHLLDLLSDNAEGPCGPIEKVATP